MAHIQVPPYTAFSPFPDMPTEPDAPSALNKLMDMLPSLPQAPSTSSAIVPVPITPELFAPFGQLILPYPDEASRTPGMDIQPSPDGKTVKYARLADIVHTYPEGSGAFTGTSVFRATPKVGLERGREFDVRFMERHPYTSQAFIPMGKAEVGNLVTNVLMCPS
jgi:allantoicase